MRYFFLICEVVILNKESCILIIKEEFKKIVDKIDDVLKKGMLGVNNKVSCLEV